MLYQDMFQMTESAADWEISNSFIRISECYKAAVNAAAGHDSATETTLRKKYEQVIAKKSEMESESFNRIREYKDPDAAFYQALHIINNDSGHQGCVAAAEQLRDYLILNPNSIMGNALLNAISEQFEER